MSRITRTIREQVTDQLRDELVAGNFAAGEQLREAELAERFGVSRGPVRDAFLQLSHEGVLTYQANRGVTVRQALDPENSGFIISLRQQIECFAIRRGISRLKKHGTASIKAALDDLKTACDGGDVATVARCDMTFHEAILLACGGDDFLPVWKLLCSQMLLAYSRLDDYQQVYDEHVAILAALESGRKSTSAAATKANIR
jgi:DNA-binding GntR family transcriptional regulator